jgi:hypothetical protein
MMRALIALICLSACTTAPVEPDPLAFQTEQSAIPASLLHPEANYPVDVHGMAGVIMELGTAVAAICGDGWISYSQHRSGTCAGLHGVREWKHRPVH